MLAEAFYLVVSFPSLFIAEKKKKKKEISRDLEIQRAALCATKYKLVASLVRGWPQMRAYVGPYTVLGCGSTGLWKVDQH